MIVSVKIFSLAFLMIDSQAYVALTNNYWHDGACYPGVVVA
jgi:hypothetical protein